MFSSVQKKMRKPFFSQLHHKYPFFFYFLFFYRGYYYYYYFILQMQQSTNRGRRLSAQTQGRAAAIVVFDTAVDGAVGLWGRTGGIMAWLFSNTASYYVRHSR